MSNLPAGRPRGRPRKKLEAPPTAVVELGAYMRQQRLAAGVENMKYAAELVRQSMRSNSETRPVNPALLGNVERGDSGDDDVMWADKDHPDEGFPRRHRVSYELVEAYDTAFGADGYLVDVYRWASLRDDELEQAPPVATPPVPAPLGGARPAGLDTVLAMLWDGFTAQDPVAGPVLAGYEASLRESYLGWGSPERRGTWIPDENRDQSTFENEPNEFRDGQLAAPGSVLIASWPLRNAGQRPWRDRLFYRVSPHDAPGIHAPRFVPVPDTDPGELAVIRVPLRAPRWPGTYQICFKIGWPNGIYSHPTTVTGVIATIVVPPRELSAWWLDTTPDAVDGTRSGTPVSGPELGEHLARGRRRTGLTQAQFGLLLDPDLPDSRKTAQAISRAETGRGWPLSAWYSAVNALERFDGTSPETARLRDLLPPVGYPLAPATAWTPHDRRDHLRAQASDLTASPPRRGYTRPAWSAAVLAPAVGDEIVKLAGELLLRLDAGSTEAPSPLDQWDAQWDLLDPADGTDIGKRGFFLAQVTLRNRGQVPWTNRLLSRLGVTVSTVMPMTPPAVPVPDTEPGGTCSVLIPGRPAHLPGMTEIHFVMTFADLRPSFPKDRRTVYLTVKTTASAGARETLQIPRRLVTAAQDLIRQLARNKDSAP